MAETLGHPILDSPYGAPLGHHNAESGGRPTDRFPVLGRRRFKPVSLVPDLKGHKAAVRELPRDVKPCVIDLSDRPPSTTNKGPRKTSRSAGLSWPPTHPGRMVMRQEGVR